MRKDKGKMDVACNRGMCEETLGCCPRSISAGHVTDIDFFASDGEPHLHPSELSVWLLQHFFTSYLFLTVQNIVVDYLYV